MITFPFKYLVVITFGSIFAAQNKIKSNIKK